MNSYIDAGVYIPVTALNCLPRRTRVFLSRLDSSSRLIDLQNLSSILEVLLKYSILFYIIKAKTSGAKTLTEVVEQNNYSPTE